MRVSYNRVILCLDFHVYQ